MQQFDSDVGLDRFRDDAFDREVMCEALAEGDARYAPVASTARTSRETIDARQLELKAGSDAERRAGALEKARKIKAAATYEITRKQLEVIAAGTVRVLLPTAPNVLRRTGIKTAREIFEAALGQLSRPEAPESIRTGHLPALQAEVQRFIEADAAEDEVSRTFAALRAALVLFKAERQREREEQYAELVKIVGKALADEFFLPAREPSKPKVKKDEGDPTPPV